MKRSNRTTKPRIAPIAIVIDRARLIARVQPVRRQQKTAAAIHFAALRKAARGAEDSSSAQGEQPAESQPERP